MSAQGSTKSGTVFMATLQFARVAGHHALVSVQNTSVQVRFCLFFRSSGFCANSLFSHSGLACDVSRAYVEASAQQRMCGMSTLGQNNAWSASSDGSVLVWYSQSSLESAVQEKSNLMSAIFTSAVDAIVVINEKGTVMAFNGAAERVWVIGDML